MLSYELRSKLRKIDKGELDISSLSELEQFELVKRYARMNSTMTWIGETCVEESKSHVSSQKAISQIREYLCKI